MAGNLAAPTFGGSSIRDPRDPKQKNGRVDNPVRYPDIGWIGDGAGAWPKTDAARMKVEKPSSIGKVKTDYESSLGR